MFTDLYTEFQERLLSANPDYGSFFPKVLSAWNNAEGLDRVRLGTLERLALALRDFYEQRSGLGDLSVLIRQYIRFNQRKLFVLPELWNLISSRAQEFHIWGVFDEDNQSFEVGVTDWTPDWLSVTESIDKPELCRYESPAMGDGLLFAATGKSSYLSQAQKNAVLASLTVPPGETLLVSLPTGGGKSLCILLPAWQDSHGGRNAGGTTLVVVPTVALAIDQERRALENFKKSLNEHYKPWSLTGSTLPQNRTIIRQGLKDGSLPLLFTSPESLLNSEIYDICMEAADYGRIKRIVIDEAHIVESWGADFRAEFQFLSTFRKALLKRSPNPPTTILLSATITQKCQEILQNLFSEKESFHAFRGNSLRAEVSYWFSHSEDRDLRKQRVFDAIYHLPRPMIVFVNKPDDAEALVAELREEGFYRIAAFSGKTANEERARILNEWSQNQRDLIIATSAFGLGVDKTDVRTVIHAAFPESIDRFYQEVGRGGRDGIKSISLMCVAKGDQTEAHNIIKSNRISTEKALSRWHAMRKTATITPPREMTVSLNAKPSYNLDLIESQRHRDWNVHVLLMLQRAGLIRITETRLVQSVGANLLQNETQQAAEIIEDSFLKFEILDLDTINNPKLLEKRIETIRNKEVSGLFGGLKQLVRLVDQYTSGAARFCISQPLSSLYPGVSISCGGCPVCRAEKRKPYSTPFEITSDLQRGIPDIAPIDTRLQSKLGAHNALNVYWDDTQDLDLFKNKHDLFVRLLQVGFRQFILPDYFFKDYSWIREFCFALSEQYQDLHLVLPHQSIHNPSKYFLLPLPSVVLYPTNSTDADELFDKISRYFTKDLITPHINIVQRSLYLNSLHGSFLDKVNGLNEPLSKFEDSLTEQLEVLDF